MNAPRNSDQVAAAIAPTLDAFVTSAGPVLRRVADEVYETLLESVQVYLRSNAEWNIGSQIDHCRTVEAENRSLLEINTDLLAALEFVTDCLVTELGNLANEDELGDEDAPGVLGKDYAKQVIAARLRIRQAKSAIAKARGAA